MPLAPVRPRHDVEPRPRRSARPALESTGGLWHLPGRRPPCRRTPRIHRWIPASAVLSSGPRSRVIVGSDRSVRASPRLMREHCAQRRTGIGTRTTYATSARSYVQTRGRTRAREVVRSPARSYLRRPLRYDRAEKRTTARLRVRPQSLPYDRASPDMVARAAGMPPTGDERAPVPLPRGASPAHRGRGRGARRTRKAKSEQGAPRRSVRARDQISTRSRTDLDAENASLGRRAGPERAGSVATG